MSEAVEEAILIALTVIVVGLAAGIVYSATLHPAPGFIHLDKCDVTSYYGKYSIVTVMFDVHGDTPVHINNLLVIGYNTSYLIPGNTTTVSYTIPSTIQPGGTYTYTVLVKGAVNGTACIIQYDDRESNMVPIK